MREIEDLVKYNREIAIVRQKINFISRPLDHLVTKVFQNLIEKEFSNFPILVIHNLHLMEHRSFLKKKI